MSKKRRTKREKIQASLRREIQFTKSGTYSFTLPSSNTPVATTISSNLPRPVNVRTYTHVVTDVRKTLITTSALLILNYALSILVQNHILRIPYLGF
ncbi:MAG: hypothetical protein COX79_00235 [Candidatus Levybacteria bacterium CG_4_10_14_0_2_um_filter_36_16]|nr:MAG: hypothetical protein AUK12_00185 [Candidatus Levybacteria bacterium CG2_30_37_29]PIR79551.1 MAG: hypothetical protein COU26_00520 [Candidatus Levybacteria bacterium CG10_big_fil_rev_8_21_14_0_10_36_30]PIZ97974.1 MAG: hypothetical protein COX79_00235 [Candidatus Levybacteria bacterium CG_4_10_14_0_2_um_filter_36_16]